jgi:hypothetical protein
MKDAHDWKAKWERMEDRGITPDLADFIADVQTDAIKSTLKVARKNVVKVLDIRYREVAAALKV